MDPLKWNVLRRGKDLVYTSTQGYRWFTSLLLAKWPLLSRPWKMDVDWSLVHHQQLHFDGRDVLDWWRDAIDRVCGWYPGEVCDLTWVSGLWLPYYLTDSFDHIHAIACAVIAFFRSYTRYCLRCHCFLSCRELIPVFQWCLKSLLSVISITITSIISTIHH